MLKARALIIGHEIHFAPNEWNEENESFITLLAHELAHIHQNTQNRVGATNMLGNQPINDDPRMEAEADQAAEAVKSGRRFSFGTFKSGDNDLMKQFAQRKVAQRSHKKPNQPKNLKQNTQQSIQKTPVTQTVSKPVNQYDIAWLKESASEVPFASDKAIKQGYQWKAWDRDFRSKKKSDGSHYTDLDAIKFAFERIEQLTGISRDKFHIHKEAKNLYGKTVPTEWRYYTNPPKTTRFHCVDRDFAHTTHGTLSEAHIGWEMCNDLGKASTVPKGGIEVGHILVNVSAGR